MSASGDTLHVYKRDKLLFASSKGKLLPLLEYIGRFVPYHRDVMVFDKVVGNAAALLLAKAACSKVYFPLGSELATRTLGRYNIEHHFAELPAFIQNRDKDGMCPMERLSIGKEPEEFYQIVRARYHQTPGAH